MKELTTWVLNEALTQCAQWRSSGRTLAVSVNVTATNLLEEGFTGLVVELLEKNSFRAPRCSSRSPRRASSLTSPDRRRSSKSCATGIIVSIDDFGAGFTSLAYLSSLAVGELKLDRGFITGLGTEGKERDLELVRATIQLGHDMRLRVVAEGIEDVDTLDLLSDLGCDRAQGYFISRPMPANLLAFKSDLAKIPVGVA